ncbi:MAG: hypothetical protein KC925_03325 [Candidatus Doudnabacteria bacterium]|nr:hypothetical protein [Candidatus Doudnabacteria bacterium]
MANDALPTPQSEAPKPTAAESVSLQQAPAPKTTPEKQILKAPKKRSLTWLWILIAVIVAGGGAGAGVYVWQTTLTADAEAQAVAAAETPLQLRINELTDQTAALQTQLAEAEEASTVATYPTINIELSEDGTEAIITSDGTRVGTIGSDSEGISVVLTRQTPQHAYFRAIVEGDQERLGEWSLYRLSFKNSQLTKIQSGTKYATVSPNEALVASFDVNMETLTVASIDSPRDVPKQTFSLTSLTETANQTGFDMIGDQLHFSPSGDYIAFYAIQGIVSFDGAGVYVADLATEMLTTIYELEEAPRGFDIIQWTDSDSLLTAAAEGGRKITDMKEVAESEDATSGTDTTSSTSGTSVNTSTLGTSSSTTTSSASSTETDETASSSDFTDTSDEDSSSLQSDNEAETYGY